MFLSLQNKLRNYSPIVTWLSLIIFLSISVTLLLVLLGVEPNNLTFFLSLPRQPGIDSWHPMIHAIQFINDSPDRSVYDLVFEQGLKFQYPLSSLLLFDLPERIFGISYIEMSFLLDRVSAISLPIFGLVSARVLIKVLRDNNFEVVTSKTKVRLIYLLVLVLTFFFYPIVFSFRIGQIQTILTVLTAIAILFWQYDKKILVGITLGLICLIKPQLGLVFVWGAIRRQWGMVLSGMLVICVFSLLSIMLYGFENNLHYIDVLSLLSQHGEANFGNHSINGLLNRFLFNGENLGWDGTFPDYNPIVHTITLITSLILMCCGLLWRFKNHSPNIIELCIIIVCTTMASPIAWQHHYAILFTISLVLFPYFYRYNANKKGKIFLLAMAYVMISQRFEFTKLFADTKFNIVQSYIFFGACIMLYFLLNVSKQASMTEKESVKMDKNSLGQDRNYRLRPKAILETE